MEPKLREDTLKHIAIMLDRYCCNIGPHRAGIAAKWRERFGSICQLNIGRHYGNYFLSWLILVRILFFINASGQLLFINAFIGNEFSVYAYEVLSKFLNGEEYFGTPRFPFVTLCDVEIRRFFTTYRYTFQCVLPINAYIEKIFLFLWFYLVFVIFASLVNLVYTILLVITPYARTSFVRKYLYLSRVFPLEPEHVRQTSEEKTKKKKTKQQRKIFRKFVSHLSHDGVFLLKILSSQGSAPMVENIIQEMWNVFLEREFQENNNYIRRGSDIPSEETNRPEGRSAGTLNGFPIYYHVNSDGGSLGYYSEHGLQQHFPKETMV